MWSSYKLRFHLLTMLVNIVIKFVLVSGVLSGLLISGNSVGQQPQRKGEWTTQGPWFMSLPRHSQEVKVKTEEFPLPVRVELEWGGR